ncbi:MAG: tetratricopeptide repeat protein [Clostridia bacterium]
MNRLKNIVIYFIFPVLLLAISLSGNYLVLIPLIIIYFTVFTVFQYENILKILAGYQTKRNNPGKALRFIYKAYKLKRSSVHTSLMLIYLLLKNEKFDKAYEIIEKTEGRVMTDYESHTLLLNKALYYWKKEKIAESLDILENLMAEGESTVLYGSYGYIVTLGDNLAKALEINEKAYGYNPNNNAIMDNLGVTYLKTGNLEKALEIYEALMKKDPGFPEAYYNMADLMQKMKDIDSAVRYMKKCIEMPFDGLSVITRRDAERKLDHLKRLQGSLQ